MQVENMDNDSNSLNIENDSPDAEPSIEEALLQLNFIIKDYLVKNPSLTVNSLSKRCGVSEPTLRRISKKELKRIPTSTTVLRLLSYISKKDKISDILAAFPGPLSERLGSAVSIISDQNIRTDEIDLSEQLKNPIKYLIYELANNSKGVTLDKVQEMFGAYGEEHLNSLFIDGIVKLKGDHYEVVHKDFCLSLELFKTHFKATADFIKPQNLNNSPHQYSQIFYNCSGSINIAAYSAILKLQRAAIRKITDILKDPKSNGEITAFVIGALDTLDTKSAFELSKQ